MENKKRIAILPWGTRLAINGFTLVLCLLIFWLLGFIIRDLQTLPAPDYVQVTELYYKNYASSGKKTGVSFVDPELREKSKVLGQQITEICQSISRKEQQQIILREGSNDIEQTLDRLNKSLIESDEKAKELASTAWQQLLERRQQIMTLGNEIVEANTESEKLQAQKREIDSQLYEYNQAADAHYHKLYNQHRLLVAFYLIAVLSPFFLVSLFLLTRCRRSPYFPIYSALGLATFLRIGYVMFEYFPAEYFKYILIGFLIAATLLLLIYAIRSVARPTLERIMKQNRESYERFLCTNCEFPIRTGPRTFLYWTRRTIHKVLPKPDSTEEEVYRCPYCGTSLYETCSACGKVRHSQLEFCRHCGAQKEIETEKI